jgi:hypothetical protein
MIILTIYHSQSYATDDLPAKHKQVYIEQFSLMVIGHISADNLR